MEETNKYWLDEGVRICVFCDKGRDNLSHYVKECREISNWFEDLGDSAEERINKLRDLSMEDGKRVVVMKLWRHKQKWKKEMKIRDNPQRLR